MDLPQSRCADALFSILHAYLWYNQPVVATYGVGKSSRWANLVAPVRVSFEPTLERLAASLGDSTARRAFNDDQLEDGLFLLLSCSDVADNIETLDFGHPTFWPYTLEASIRMALAVYVEFLPDWDACFFGGDVPECVPQNFASRVYELVRGWVINPTSFSWDVHAEHYDWIKNDVCLDGYLSNDHPSTPPIVQAYCYSALYLIDIENCQDNGEPMVRDLVLDGRFAARTDDTIAWFLDNCADLDRIRDSLWKYVCPWCLGKRDPLR